MGNAMPLPSCSSCSSADIMCVTKLSSGCVGGPGAGGSRLGTAVVVHTGAERLVEVGEGTTVAEVMMDSPNHFVVVGDSPEFAPGKRPAALPAHQELVPNRAYFLLPMQKLRGRLSAQDVAHMAQLAQRLVKRSSLPRDRCILPAATATAFAPRLHLHKAAFMSDRPPEPSLLSTFINRTPPPPSMWRPTLQTIDETPHLRSWTFREGLLMA